MNTTPQSCYFVVYNKAWLYHRIVVQSKDSDTSQMDAKA